MTNYSASIYSQLLLQLCVWGPRFVCLDVRLASATERRDDPEFREALTENVERSPRRPLGLNQGTARIVKKGEPHGTVPAG